MPCGWHLPDDKEWVTLITYLGGEEVAGIKLKEAGDFYWFHSNNMVITAVTFQLLQVGGGGNNLNHIPMVHQVHLTISETLQHGGVILLQLTTSGRSMAGSYF